MPRGVYIRKQRTADEILLGAADRFWAKVKKAQDDNACWLWTASKDTDGYGRFWSGVRHIGAHRFSLILAGRETPDSMFVDHKCRNRACVNPDHLRAATPQENSIENSVGIPALNAAKTHCERGHELIGSNLYTRKNGHRLCRQCQKEASRAHRLNNSEEYKAYYANYRKRKKLLATNLTDGKNGR